MSILSFPRLGLTSHFDLKRTCEPLESGINYVSLAMPSCNAGVLYCRDVCCVVLTSVLSSFVVCSCLFSLGVVISVVQTVSFTFQASLGDS